MPYRRADLTRWMVIVWCLAGALPAAADGDRPVSPAEPPVVAVAATEPDAFTFRVRTPPVRITPEGDGFSRVEIEGFEGRHGRAGAPDLPVHTVRVALPPGATPRLEIRLIGPVTGRDARPVPLAPPLRRLDSEALPPGGAEAIAEMGPEAREALRRGRVARRLVVEDRAVYESRAVFPENVAWLGEVGQLRDQRYVAVNIAPVRWNGDRGDLEIQPEIEITVRFEGAEVELATPPRADERFESVYRSSFVNYGQGRRFRVGPVDATPPFEAVSPAGAPGGWRYRIRIRSNGVVRLDHAYLSAHAPELLAHPTGQWKLTSQGQPVPLQVRQIPGGGSDDTLLDRSGEFVQFHGQAYDQEPETTFIGTDGTSDELHGVNDFTDENVYFLEAAGTAQGAMTERDATPGLEPQAGPSFVDTAHAEVENFFIPWKGSDLWYWSPLLAEDGTTLRSDPVALPGLWSGNAPITVRVNLRGASDCLQYCPDPMNPATCVGVFESHETGVGLRNASSQTLELPLADPNNANDVNLGEFPGRDGFTHAFTWTHAGGDPVVTSPLTVRTQVFQVPGLCSEPTNTVRNDVLVNWIEVDYAREFRAVGNTLAWTWSDGPAVRFAVAGFTTSDVEVYELGDFVGSSYVRNVTRLTGVSVAPASGTFTATFRMDNDPALTDGTLRRFVAVANAAVPTPDVADFERDRGSNLASDTTQADLVVIAHPGLIESTCSIGGNPCDTHADCTSGESDTCQLDPSSALGQFLALRASQGITARLARLPDVEDEFNDGLAGPTAVENFLSFVLNGGWQSPAPSYVLLLGDGTYHYKAGTTAGGFVPTQIVTVTEPAFPYYSSDNLMVDVVGSDSIPDAVIGRLPARTLAEADGMLQKLIGYDTTAPAGSWRSNSLFVSDRGYTLQDVGEAGGFETINNIGIDKIVPPYTYQNLRYWSDNCFPGHPTLPTCDPGLMKSSIKAGVNGTLGGGLDGASLMQFTGHGSFDLWSNDVFFCTDETLPFCVDNLSQPHDDSTDLNNGLKLPWLIAHNCLTGGFHQLDAKTFGEQWIKAAGGGAAAVYAPSGLGFQYLGMSVTPNLWGPLFGPAKERQIAVPILENLVARCSGANSAEACQFYVLLGDPSMRLVLPDIGPAVQPLAVAGNGVVELSWLASSTPGVTYDVYRKLSVNPFAYTQIATGVAATSYTDLDVLNAATYRYYVVARDPAGFESAWSNFNSDCDEPPGPDCLQATPLNPTAASKPTGLVVLDTETGGTASATWSPNPENDVDFYTLHYGTTPAFGQTTAVGPPGPLDQVVPTPAVILTGLANGVVHYFAVTATNTSGLTSVLSDTFAMVPNQVLGVKSPEFVSDLRLGRSGNDAELTWSAVTTDIYDKPIQVTSYEVFRSTNLHFVPAPPNRIATVAAPGHVDANLFVPGGPNYFYLVRGRDAAGNPGGVGRQLPAGIRDLELGVAGGQLVLSWTPVSTDFDGLPTWVTHYQLWVSSVPMSREAIEQGAATLLQDGITGTSVTIALEPTEPRYYSVLAVDVRGNRSPF